MADYYDTILSELVNRLHFDSQKNKNDYLTSGTNFEKPVLNQLKKLLETISSRNNEEKPVIIYNEGSHDFPDIRISFEGHKWGIEVKSSSKESSSWRINGNSIFGESRASDLDEVYVLFGHVSGAKSEFRFAKLENCIVDIAVTHSPRYILDLDAKEKDLFFPKIKMTMDEFEKSRKQIEILKEYFQAGNKKSWWTESFSNSDDSQVVPAEIRFLNKIDNKEANELIGYGLAHFPEMIAFDKRFGNDKYERFATFLISQQSIVCTNIRDIFSAGGKFELNGKRYPHVLATITKYWVHIRQALNKSDESLDKDWNFIFQRVPSISLNKDREKESSWIRISANLLTEYPEFSDYSLGEIEALVKAAIKAYN